MSIPAIKFNILASYLSQIYLIVANIIVLPLYIKYMGAESYGLVAFFLLLQGLFLLLDFGLTPTLSRQATLLHSNVVDKLQFLQIFRCLSVIFYGLAIIAGGGLFLLSNRIIYHWITIEQLNIEIVRQCFYIMIVCVVLRWLVGLYRGIIVGFEQIVWLSIVNVIVATLKFFGVIAYMAMVGFDVINFFIVQVVVGFLEFFLFFFKAKQLLPKSSEPIKLDFKAIRPLLAFSLSIGFTSFVWIIVTQLDKFILSGILTLSDYGYFSLAVMVAGAIIQISTPISNAIMPRMAFLYSENNSEQLRQTYLDATQIVAVIVVTAGLILAFFAEPILYIWSNDSNIAKNSAMILRLYACGNVFLALSAFPYYLQYAKGDMRYHLRGNILSLIILLPSIIYCAYHYGAIGAGWVWLITHLCFLLFWVSFVHFKIEPYINLKWFNAFLPSVLAVSLFLYIMFLFVPLSNNRLIALTELIGISIMALIVAMIGSKFFREMIGNKLLSKLNVK